MYAQQTHYFLGANSPQGFYSLYSELVDLYADDTLYILKGGPGCGKSSFMKRIGAAMEKVGLWVEYIHCTADPDSLDAIYIPALKTAYVDGTAPHVIEPKYPAAMEQYVNLGVFYDSDAIKRKKSEIIELNRDYGNLFTKAYDCISAAHKVTREISAHVADEHIIEAIRKRARGIISREIGKKQVHPRGKTVRRFLTAFTWSGFVSRFDTVGMLAERVYLLDNGLGLAHYLLSDIAEAAGDVGLDTVLCPSFMDPEKIEHLLIPQLSLAFISTTPFIKYDAPGYRHIRLDAMAEGEKLRAYKARIRFSKKVFSILMQEAESTLSDAKQLHDKLEAIYNPHVDFDEVYGLADAHIKILLDKSGKIS